MKTYEKRGSADEALRWARTFLLGGHAIQIRITDDRGGSGEVIVQADLPNDHHHPVTWIKLAGRGA